MCSNYLPLQFTILPQKLKAAGFETHMIGKGHLVRPSLLSLSVPLRELSLPLHAPVRRGTKPPTISRSTEGSTATWGTSRPRSSVSPLPHPPPIQPPLRMGATLNDRRALDADYHGLSNNQKNFNRTHRVGPCFLNQPSADPKAAQCHYDMWQDKAQAPPEIIDSLYYSANVFAARAIEKINARATGAPLYIHLTWQNVHAPSVPAFSPCSNTPHHRRHRLRPALTLTEPFDVSCDDRYSPPPDWENLKSSDYLSNYCPPTDSDFPMDMRCNFGGMLKVVDDGMKNGAI